MLDHGVGLSPGIGDLMALVLLRFDKGEISSQDAPEIVDSYGACGLDPEKAAIIEITSEKSKVEALGNIVVEVCRRLSVGGKIVSA